MEILFLAHRIPYPPDRGDKIRSFHILKRLAEFGRVHLACFADDTDDAAHLSALRAAIGANLGEAHVEVRTKTRLRAGIEAFGSGRPISVAAFDSKRMRTFVDAMLTSRGIDTIFVFSGQMAQFVPANVGARFVMDFVDMDSAKFGDYAQAGEVLAPVHRREAATLLAFERTAAIRADVSLFVSEAEAAMFRARTGLSHADIRALQNGVDLTLFDPSSSFAPAPAGQGPMILFTGQMDYRPNVDAVVDFARSALPVIRRFRPDARFVIAGRNPAPEVRRLAGDGVVVTGAVADMRSWLAAADVVVAPLRIARGVQNKVLEAMAMARRVVASSAAFEGIEAQPGRDLLVADDPAEAILSLLANPARAIAMGQAARSQVETHYRWDARLAPLADIVAPGRHRAAA